MSNELIIKAQQNPGIVSFDNYEEVKAIIEERVNAFNSIDYSTQSLEDITQDRDELKSIKKQLDSVWKGLEKAYNEPLEDVKGKLQELISIVKVPLDKLDKIVKETEDDTKRNEIMQYAKDKASELGPYAEKILGSKSFFDKKWLYKGTTTAKWRKAVDEIISNAKADIDYIINTGGNYQSVMLAKYYDQLSMDGMAEFLKNVNTTVEETKLDVEEDLVTGYKIIKVYGNERKMFQLFSGMDLLEIEYEEIEDGMPKDMDELTDPSFDSFVAFDIEHTGSLGAGKGDADAEIIEIGAVKVINGEIVEKFDELANPEREIVPIVARLTGITDDMVKDKPDVNEVIAKFRGFADGCVLVGHNITGCDIPHIQRAAKRAGFKFENKFLDTKKLAKKLQDKYGWENIKLTTLSKYFNIGQSDAHKAWCDAEANAYVYLKLKGLT